MNSVVLIGRLTKDPELRYTQSNMAVCTFTLAVDRPYSKNRRDGDQTADFIRIKVFGAQGENCDKYLCKGRKTAVQGRIQTGSYENKNGDRVYTTDVIASRVEFLEYKDGNNGKSYTNMNGETVTRTDWQRNQNPPPQEPQQYQVEMDEDIPDGYMMVDEDDVPF